MVRMTEVQAVVGRGLEGDRYFITAAIGRKPMNVRLR